MPTTGIVRRGAAVVSDDGTAATSA
jgi:hypothetical protein